VPDAGYDRAEINPEGGPLSRFARLLETGREPFRQSIAEPEQDFIRDSV
jgi:hypothetical protein